MTKRIVLCADDYGQAEAISSGILALIEKQRLSATSCLVTAQNFAEQGKWLLPFRGKVGIGLHFNLTDGQALSKQMTFLPLSTLLLKASLRQLRQSDIEAELNAQIDRFNEIMGQLPDYLDGHQHVHQFPVIRDAVIKVYEERLRERKSYIRLVNMRIKPSDLVFDFKKWVIFATGTWAFKRLLLSHNIPHNQSFAGIYSFKLSDDYRTRFQGFLSEIGEQGLIMCHPGLLANDPHDPIASTREKELQYLESNAFIEDCKTYSVILTYGVELC